MFKLIQLQNFAASSSQDKIEDRQMRIIGWVKGLIHFTSLHLQKVETHLSQNDHIKWYVDPLLVLIAHK